MSAKPNPLPVGLKAFRVLQAVCSAALLRTNFTANQAPSLVERLRRGGYVSVSEHGYVYATKAGMALLKRASKLPAVKS